MSRQAKDPGLSQLAVELKTIKFSDAPDLEEVIHERFAELAKGQGEYPFRLVYQMPDFKTWVVRLYLGGSVRTIGFSSRLCDACRYADMAALRFWKYRVRGASEPVDANLNFDLAQAKFDSANETDALNLLDRIEEYLLLSDVLGDPVQSEIDRQKNRKARDARRTVRSDFHALIGQLSDKIDALAKKVDQLSPPVWNCDPPRRFPDQIKGEVYTNEREIRGVQSGPVPEEVKVVAQSAVATLENLFDNKPKP